MLGVPGPARIQYYRLCKKALDVMQMRFWTSRIARVLTPYAKSQSPYSSTIPGVFFIFLFGRLATCLILSPRLMQTDGQNPASHHRHQRSRAMGENSLGWMCRHYGAMLAAGSLFCADKQRLVGFLCTRVLYRYWYLVMTRRQA